MDKIGYGKSGGWIVAVGVLFCLLAAITAQPGFLSIDCGGKSNYTDENKIQWVTDANYIDDLGETADIGNATEEAYGSHLTSLRFFPKPLKKSCYHLPVDPLVPYLLRLWFAQGNYSGVQPESNFAFSIETMGMLSMENVTSMSKRVFLFETILVSSGRVLYICLIRTSESDDPFISSIELRKLQTGMYGYAKPGTMLRDLWRNDVGGNLSVTRYPQDNFDRIWDTDVFLNVSNIDFERGLLSSKDPIPINTTEDLPSTFVMQTAWLLNSSVSIQLPGPSAVGRRKSLLLLYFAEIENMVDTQLADRSFYVTINGENRSEIITLPRNHSAVELTFLSNYSAEFQFALMTATGSRLPPIVNAFEYYIVYDTERATYPQDVEALDAMKSMYDLKTWISDPCFLIEWEGIRCHHSSSAIRISDINLSRRNLFGSVPDYIGQLTASVNVSLDNNYLTGPLPNFSNLTKLEILNLQNNSLNCTVPDWLSQLTSLKELKLANNDIMGSLPNLSSLMKLERLHLQNNSLTGSVPDWLSQLKNLKELFIENNNFSGEIPLQLLQKPSLNLLYFGNPYLFIPPTSNLFIPPTRNQKKVRGHLVLGITLSGVLIIIGVLLIAGSVLYRKKTECVTTENNGVELEMVVDSTSNNRIDSTIMVPNSVNASAFTLDQMMAATHKFSGNIGKGGFGSVFFGKLPEGKNIAVKVLSLFSTQGVQQFLNEIDVLSKVNHENLVSLLGYCNESKELMIIYEHMSGGSLRDRLYGPNAGSELDWKTRVRIALDAAQGLEYMHIVCTPKIIHRDVKTANILLDSNLKGKLGDFGLSRIWIDGEASYVTTMVKGTAGYLDPEYFSTERLTEKSDVYSFGVVLLEMICGRRPIDANLSGDKLNIIRWATPLVEMDAIDPGKIEEIVDKRLGGNYDIKSVTRVAKIAIRCVKAEPYYRPSVSEVVAELREAINVEETRSSTISNLLP